MQRWWLGAVLFLWVLVGKAYEGLGPDTLVLTPRLQPFVPLGTLKKADVIGAPQPGYLHSYSSVKYIMRSAVPHFVEITLNNFRTVHCGTEQLFYSPTHAGWTQAQNLVVNDTLLTINNKTVTVTALTIINQPSTLVALACYHPHTFAITEYGVVVHNMELMPFLNFIAVPLLSSSSSVATVGTSIMSSTGLGSITLVSIPSASTVLTSIAATTLSIGTAAY